MQLLQQRRQAGEGPADRTWRERDALSPQQFLTSMPASMPADASNSPAGPGKVFLVGTGPGDPGLLTLRAVQLMQTADVVLYDRLVSDDILRLVHGGARMVYVGKQAGYHTRTQVRSMHGFF